MRLLVWALILTLFICAALASNAHKPFDLRIDAQSPGVWPKYAEANTEQDFIEAWVCGPVWVPTDLTTGKRTGVTRT